MATKNENWLEIGASKLIADPVIKWISYPKVLKQYGHASPICIQYRVYNDPCAYNYFINCGNNIGRTEFYINYQKHRIPSKNKKAPRSGNALLLYSGNLILSFVIQGLFLLHPFLLPLALP